MFEKRGLMANQKAFAAALRSHAGEAEALTVLAGDDERNRVLLGVYRANTISNACKALSLAYPVIAQIVGDEFFEALSREFWRQTPPLHGNLNTYGAEFADFLAAFEHVQDMPYLPDVARVEWKLHCAYAAADHQSIFADVMASVSPEQIATCCFEFQASLALFASDWPVFSIWTQHQADYVDEVNVDLDQAQTTMIYRHGLRPALCELSEVQTAFWSALMAGQSLGAALELAFEIDEEFDAGSCLNAGFAREWITGLHQAAAE